jgi:arylformamidase
MKWRYYMMQKNYQYDYQTTTWIDISIPIHNGMVQWPHDPPVRVERVMDLERGDGHNMSQLLMGSHTGTHVDAPLHFLKNGAGIDEFPLNIVNGKVRVLEVSNESINPGDLTNQNIRPGERILFKTSNSSLIHNSDRFTEKFVFVTEKAARFLVDNRVSLVGIDYLSIGSYQGGSAIHRILLSAGIWIIESLDLSDVIPGEYEMVCLPLKIVQGDGAPARVILRKLD